MYQKIIARNFGDSDVLKVETVVDLPEPRAGEARVKVTAAGVGYTDTIVRRGRYIGYKGGVPVTPGYDMVGMVDAIGPGVTTVSVGDRVADMPVTGAYSQYLLRPADSLIPVPASVADNAAIEVPLMWVTAWQMLTRSVGLDPGAWILVVGASGSMGRALVLLARHLNLRVIGTCSAANLSEVEAPGVVALDYRRADLVAAIRQATGGGGVAAAFDAIAGDSWIASRRALAAGGTLVGYGMQAFLDGGSSALVAIRDLLRLKLWSGAALIARSQSRYVFYNIQTRRGTHPDDYREDALTLLGLVASGTVTPPAAEILPLGKAAEAHRRIASGGLATRIVLDPWRG